MPKKEPNTRAKRKTKTPAYFDDYQTELQPKRRKLKQVDNSTTIKGQGGFKKHKSVILEQSFFSKAKKSKNSSMTTWRKTIETLGIDNMTVTDYIPSDIDKSGLVSVKSVNLLKKHGGRGLFAATDIAEGTCIGIYTGEVYSTISEFDEYLEANPEADNSYAMAIGGRMVDAAQKGNFTRYINFSDSRDSVEFVEGKLMGHKVVKVRATRDIKKGEQLLVNYNTYEERASKLYYFLNPGDGWQSASELYETHSAQYELLKMPFGTNLFRLKKNTNIYATSIGKAILEGNAIADKEEMPDTTSINLPFLKSNSSKGILDFDEADAFTPLMMACYLGQLENVRWLIDHGADLSQQQNHSGNCPLFFALEGYAETDSTASYLKIIQRLITSEANIFAHDRADKTFLHKAVSVLSTKDFKTIMTLMAKQEHIEFSDLFSYIDENDFDIFTCCLENKSFDKAKILLDMFPDYFNETSQGKESTLLLEKAFKKAIKDYDEDDNEALLKLLSNKKYKVPESFLEELTPSEDEYYSDGSLNP
jgi:hypothetical protein